MTHLEDLASDVLLGRLPYRDAALVRADLSLDDLRTATLTSLLALAAQHNLRMPRGISSNNEPECGPCLHLSFDRDSDVDQWADVLGLGKADDSDGSRFAVGVGLNAPVWLAWNQVHARCLHMERIAEALSDALPEACSRCGHDESVHEVGDGARCCIECQGFCVPVGLPADGDCWAIQGRTQ